MPNFLLLSERHGTIAWWKGADGDAAHRVVLIAIPVRRSMEPTGHGAASAIGQPIPTLGVPATTTLSRGCWLYRTQSGCSMRVVEPTRQRPHRLLANEHITTKHQNVQFGPQEAVKCFRRFADDRFILVERGVENHWDARQLTKGVYKRVKRSVGFF